MKPICFSPLRRNPILNTSIKTLLTAAALAVGVAGSASAATYTWTGAGVDANDLDAADNWTGGLVPASGNKLGTGPSTVGGASDLISFDSETATALPTGNIEAVRISSNGTQFPSFELLNGTLNFNRAEVWSHPGTTITIGDGDLSTAAQINFIATINLARLSSGTTYAINADGTLQINANFTFSSTTNTVVNLLGGSVNSDGAVLSGLTNQATNFVSFQSADSTFTAEFGGQFADITDVTAQLGDSFKDTTGNGLAAVDNLDGSFTVSVVPEPGAPLLGALGVLLLLRRRR